MSFWSRPSPSSVTLDRGRFGAANTGLLAVLALVVSACAQQSEGQRCDPLSGSEDCDEGLICVPLDALRPGAEGAVCCPTDNPSENICRSNNFDYTPDGGTVSSASPDGGGTTGSTIPSDAGSGASGTDDAADASSVSSSSSSTEDSSTSGPSTNLESSTPTSDVVSSEPNSTASSTSGDGGNFTLDAGEGAPDSGT